MRAILIASLIALFGCADFPKIGEGDAPQTRDAPYPRIVPIEGLLIRALGPTEGGAAPRPLDQVADPLDARVASLRARAAILRGAPVNDQTRARLSGG